MEQIAVGDGPEGAKSNEPGRRPHPGSFIAIPLLVSASSIKAQVGASQVVAPIYAIDSMCIETSNGVPPATAESAFVHGN